MEGRYRPGQTVYLSGARPELIKEATVLKYTGGLYTIRLKNGGGTRARESRLFSSRQEAETAIRNGKR